MTIKIIALYDRNEDFIEFQYKSIKKFVENDVEFIVFNNSSDRERRNKISLICNKLGITVFNISVDYALPPSEICASALNFIWENHLKKMDGIVLNIDSDMFFISDFNIQEKMKNYDIMYVPNYRGENFEVEYIWSGMWCFDLNKIEKSIDFSLATILGHRTDAAGSTYYFLKNKNYNKLYLRLCTFYDNDSANFQVTLNGHHLMNLNNFPNIKKMFPHEKELENYVEKCRKEYKEHELMASKFEFPRPYNFDLIKLENDDNYFIFHYKSSNWEPRYGNGKNQYSLDKKQSLIRMLSDKTG